MPVHEMGGFGGRNGEIAASIHEMSRFCGQNGKIVASVHENGWFGGRIWKTTWQGNQLTV